MAIPLADDHRALAATVGDLVRKHEAQAAARTLLESARVAFEEVLKRFPAWDVDWERAVQAHTWTIRGWDALPVVTR